MKFVPMSVSRIGGRSLLKLQANSPTLLVVSGVVGLGATAVMAARASRRLDPILDEHKQMRASIGYVKNTQDQEGQKSLAKLYAHTGFELTKLYGPSIFVGTTSAIAVLGGHKILKTRHVATMAAYSGLAEQFAAYRSRIVKTLGEEVERGIYEGAHGEYEEIEGRKGEYQLQPKFDQDSVPESYLRPWFDETNVNWTRDPVANYLFLKGVQQHMNNMLQIRGHVFLNDVLDALRMDRVPEAAVSGWIYKSPDGDSVIDFGFMTGIEPHTVAFRNGLERTVRLNFNIDKGAIWHKI